MNDFVYGLHNNSITVEGEKKSRKEYNQLRDYGILEGCENFFWI